LRRRRREQNVRAESRPSGVTPPPWLAEMMNP
jgi:hypothetical protein